MRKPAVSAKALRAELRKLADPAIAEQATRYFQVYPGGYGEGDRFLGIRVPRLRELARRHRDLPQRALLSLLRSRFHEERLLALFILTLRYARGDAQERDAIYRCYLENTEYIDKWDLVDASAPRIVGAHLMTGDRGVLRRLARSENLWERRIAMISTFAFIKAGEVDETYRIAELLVDDEHDLIHKAVGWMLREAGKRDPRGEREFLNRHLRHMPRTMLRYAIEKFPERERKQYLAVVR